MKRPPLNEILAGLSYLEMGTRPSLNLYEGWQDEAGIDPAVWTWINPATGAAWARGAVGAYLRATTVPVANETARLRSNQRWIAAPGIYATNTILRRLILEFELRLTNVANLDNTICFFGLTTGIGDTRATNNIIGWALLADVLQSVTDNGGAESTTTGFGETLTNMNKLRLEAYLGHVRFFINEVQVADHIANLPSFPFYLNFFVDTEAGGAGTIELGIVRAWTEDLLR
jgi:hypothetical protein